MQNNIICEQSGLLAPNGKQSNLSPENHKLVRSLGFKQWYGDWENDSTFPKNELDENGEPIIVVHKRGNKFEQGGLLAPNLQPSKLTPEQYKLVRTPEFKAWFGDWENDTENASKVVDKNGEPLVVYHVTDKEFNIFDKKKSKGGFFFSANKNRLKAYNKKRILEVFLNIKNPSNDEFNVNGYDGIMDFGEIKIKDASYLYEIIAFYPNQIKLADSTNTTFDANNPDIRYEEGGNLGQEITCVNCGWHWNTNQSDEFDKYVCHKCGFDNRTFYDSEPIGIFEQGGVFDEYNNARIKKVYVSIKIKNEIKQDETRKYKIESIDDKVFSELKNHKLLGVEGVSSSKYNIADWLTYRECLIVMNFDDFIKENDAEQIHYEDAQYLTQNGLDIMFRIYNRKEKDDSNYYSILQNLFPKIALQFQLEAQLYSDSSSSQYYFFEHIFNVYNSNKFITYFSKHPRVFSVKEFVDIAIKYFESGDSENDYRYIRQPEVIDYENITKIIDRGIVNAIKVYKDESEWVLKNKELNVPNGSQLMFVLSSYENMKDVYENMIAQYDLKKSYKINYVNYADVYKFQQNKFKTQDTEFKQNLETKKILVNKKIKDILKETLNTIIEKIEDKFISEMTEYNPPPYSDYDDTSIKYGDNPLNIPKIHNLWIDAMSKLIEFYDSEIDKIVQEKHYWTFVQIFYKYEDYVRNMRDEFYQNEDTVVAYCDNLNYRRFYISAFYDNFLRAIKSFDYRDFIKDIKVKIGYDLYNAYSKDEVNFKEGGAISNYLAPNGKPSNLTPEQYKLVRTPEFKAWFGDWERLALLTIKDSGVDEITLNNIAKDVSKVVDENGEPLVVYHYTKNDFTVFKLQNNSYFDTFFFTPYKIGNSNDEFSWRGNRIIGVFLNIKRLSVLSNIDKKNWSRPYYEDKWIIESKKIEGQSQVTFDGTKFKGYPNSDGIKFIKSIDEKEIIVAFNSNQIKLADGTNTTFNGNNPDIRYEDGGKTDYSDYVTSVIALYYNDKILILKRGSTAPWMPNKWSLVGGGVEPNENPQMAIIRECEEEIGLTPTNVQFIEKINTEDVGQIYYYVGQLHTDKVILDYENSDFAFISEDELNDYEFIPYVKDFIANLFLSQYDAKNNNTLYSFGGRISSSKGLLPNVRGGWTKPKILKYFKEWSSDTMSTYTLTYFISQFDNWEQLKDSLYYHGTTNSIDKGLKPSITLSEKMAEQIGGGGYGQRYWGISLTKRKKTAESFSGMLDYVGVYPVFLKKDAKIIERTDLQDSSEIEDIIVELYENGIDAVWIGGGEEELVVVNPQCILLYKDGREGFRVFGGFKSQEITDERLKEIYNESKLLWEKYYSQYKVTANKDEKKEFLQSIKPITFREGGMLKTPHTIQEIAKKHKVDENVIKNALKIGINTEKEHTNDISIAKTISLHHLYESPSYYNKLQKMEKTFKNGGELIEHGYGKIGGVLVGRRHSEGGIKAINKATNQPLEMEGGEVVITRNAVSDNTKREFEGKMMTNKEILSKINESGGGVSFAKGGSVNNCGCTGKKYKYGGQMMTDFDIVNAIQNASKIPNTINERLLDMSGIKYAELKPSEAIKNLYSGLTYKQGGNLENSSDYLIFVNKRLPSLDGFLKLNKKVNSPFENDDEYYVPIKQNRLIMFARGGNLEFGKISNVEAYKTYLYDNYAIKFKELPVKVQNALLMGKQSLIDNYINE